MENKTDLKKYIVSNPSICYEQTMTKFKIDLEDAPIKEMFARNCIPPNNDKSWERVSIVLVSGDPDQHESTWIAIWQRKLQNEQTNLF